MRADVVVVGAGPAGSAAAAWACRAGRDVLVIDSAQFPRDKACGDGLTPRGVLELRRLGLGPWLAGRVQHRGLRLSGFGACSPRTSNATSTRPSLWSSQGRAGSTWRWAQPAAFLVTIHSARPRLVGAMLCLRPE